MAGIPAWAMLIGGMKCGSTTLHRHLAWHPQIAASHPKEPEYLAIPAAWAKGPRWYEERFGFQEGRHRYALDGSSAYSNLHRHPDVPSRMAQLPGTKRIVYVVRDPIARIRSHIRHDAATPWGGHPDGPLSPDYVASSDYTRQLDAYLDHFSRRDIHVLTLDDLARDPAAALRRVCRFLHIDSSVEFPDLGRRRNVGAGGYLRTRAWVHGVWRATPGFTLRRALRWGTQRARRTPWARPLVFAPAPQLEMPAGWEDATRAALAPSMQRLQREWGVDVGAWGF